jgi:hypothetical protein
MAAEFERVIASRLKPSRSDDVQAGASAAELAAVMTSAFRRWVRSGGKTSLNSLIRRSFGALRGVLADERDEGTV